MKKTKFSKLLSFVLSCVLIAAMALSVTGCNDSKSASSDGSKVSSSESGAASSDDSSSASSDNGEIGEGKTQFTLKVTFTDGSEKTYTVNSDEATVGAALTKVGLISGTVGDYGLMVETVDGETVKYEDSGKYWAFYIDGEYAMTGVDSTELKAGSEYALKVE